MARPMPRLPPVTIAVLPENIRKGFYRGVPPSEKLILAVRMTGTAWRLVLPMRWSFDCCSGQNWRAGDDFHLVDRSFGGDCGFQNDDTFHTSSSCLRRIIWL